MPSQPTERPNRITHHCAWRKLPAIAAAVAVFALMPIAPARAQPVVLNEVAKLRADDGNAVDQFGVSSAISGDTAVVGAHLHGDNGLNSGAAYAYIRHEEGRWEQEAELLASDGVGADQFGLSVSISGNTAVVGAPGKFFNTGAAYVFVRSDGGVWTEQAKLTASDGDWSNSFGIDVAISGDTILVGAFNHSDTGSNAGAAYIFTRDANGVWTQQAELLASDGAANDFFGLSVDIQGDIAVVGAIHNEGNEIFSGSAYVFVRGANGVWTQQAKLIAFDGEFLDRFGNSVAISGNTIVVGANWHDDNGSNSGSAYLFTRDDKGVWTQQAKLLASDGAKDDFFGGAVAMNDSTVIIAAGRHGDNGDVSGSAYIYRRGPLGFWRQRAKLLASDGAAGDFLGGSVAISDDTAVIGAFDDQDNGYKSGSAYIFDLDDDAHSDGDADFDDDGKVDADDLSSLLSQWGARGGPADLNKDGTVDSTDLGLLLANWG